MKIAILVNSAWAAFNFRLNLASRLKEEGFEVVFIIPFDNKYSKKIQDKFECHNFYINAKGLNPFQDIFSLVKLYRIFNQIKPDVLCTFTIKPNIYGSIVANLLGIYCINNITGLGTLFIKNGMPSSIAKLLYKLALSRSDIVFFQNSKDKLYFLDSKLVKKSKTRLIPGSGVDLVKFKPVITAKKDNFVFLLISRLLKDKGIYEFINAVRIIKENNPELLIEFQILGELGVKNRTAIQTYELEKWIEDKLIKYLGVSNNVNQIIAQSDCVVLPSYREGMPRVILEAFAMKKPVIVSNVPGCVDIVEDGVNGFICEVKSSIDLADKMLKMVSITQDKREKMTLNGRNKVEKFFDEKIVIESYLDPINLLSKNEKII